MTHLWGGVKMSQGMEQFLGSTFKADADRFGEEGRQKWAQFASLEYPEVPGVPL